MGEVKLKEHAWVNEFPAAVTVTDVNGIILEMNDKAPGTTDVSERYHAAAEGPMPIARLRAGALS